MDEINFDAALGRDYVVERAREIRFRGRRAMLAATPVTLDGDVPVDWDTVPVADARRE